MARLIDTPSSGGIVGSFEPIVLQTLLDKLPNDYAVAPNFQMKQRGREALEYDFVVLAPHAVYVVEAKEWYGRLTGDDSEWLLNQKPKKCPLFLINHKCKVLKNELGPVGNVVYVSPVLVVPDGTVNHLGGAWASHVRSLTGLIAYLQDASKVTRAGAVAQYHTEIVKALQGRWGARQRATRQRIGSYTIEETIARDEASGEYLARHSLLEADRSRYRIRTWRLNPTLAPAEPERQKAIIRRPTEAVAKVGPHPNLLRVLEFNFVDEDSEFYEVTEWSELGTLHGYLANADRDKLTLRERIEIAEGVANALVAVHAHGVVHRNVSPQSILIGFDRRPRLTDFDRAYIESQQTVWKDTQQKTRNLAYVPPELEGPDYEFDEASDVYSLGVLLYQLLTDQVPFETPTAARAANGKPLNAASALRNGVAPELDALIESCLRVDDFHARPTAVDALATLRSVLGMTTGAASAAVPPPPTPSPQKLEVGAVIRGLRIDAVLGQGGFARVYRVYHFDMGRPLAMKILDDADNADKLLHEVQEIWPKLPNHPNIVKPIWVDRLDPDNKPYVLSELVDGETLEAFCNGTKRLPWSAIREIGLQLLDALATIHPDTRELEHLRELGLKGDLTSDQFERVQELEQQAAQGIVHRDIKPANIMLEMPSYRPRLIDFNVAALAEEAASPTGTRPYIAPDRLQCPGPSSDLFSLGVVLYQLVLNRHPYRDETPGRGDPYDPGDIAFGFRISNELAEFLLKAVRPDAADRFVTAREMAEALREIPSMHAPADAPPPSGSRFPHIQVTPEEGGRRNYNPYVTRLLTLYSQAHRTNSGTRGYDEIARATYVETALDEKLAPAIVDGGLRLVIVTGNAGDGKTAFLERVEALFEKNGATLSRLGSRNGSRWSWHGVEYETNYDGSQDEGDRSNDDVLERFFLPFEGASLGPVRGDTARLVAINEGRLLDFLHHGPHAARFAGLASYVHDALEGKANVPGALLVNLNWRAVTANGRDSLVERQLSSMLRDFIWAPCDDCAYRDRCPIKHNVETLRDPISGPATRERVRRLFEIVHLRRRAHITMRDLRSALSWMLLRDHGCEAVERLLSRTDDRVGRDLAALNYVHAFASSAESDATAESSTAEQADERAVDRLVRRLREVDVGLVNSPQLDRRVDHDAEKAVPWMAFERRSKHAWEVMRGLARAMPSPGDDVPPTVLLRERRGLVAAWRRWAYFERYDEGWRSMLPFRSIGLLENIIQSTGDAHEAACRDLRDRVVDAISRHEGVRNDAVCRRYVALKITRVREASVRSYRLFPKEGFHVEVVRPAGASEYLEYAPDAVDLVAADGVARLRISLDLLEMLDLIRTGYRPTPADLQGLFVNLLIFRNELLASTFARVLVTNDDEDFFEIAASAGAEGIHLSLARYTAHLADKEAP